MTTDAIENLTQPSLADIAESELLRRLLSAPRRRSDIIGLHGIPDDVASFQDVPLDGLPGSPKGDIDLLLVPPGDVTFATAIQAKRIRVHAATFKSDIPNKIHELAKGRRQTNLLEHLGFAQVYFFVLVTVDSRARNGGRMSFDGLTPELERIIDAAVTLTDLHPRIGLVHFEFVQSMDDAPLSTGTFRGHMKRLAHPIPQPREISEWVNAIVKARA